MPCFPITDSPILFVSTCLRIELALTQQKQFDISHKGFHFNHSVEWENFIWCLYAQLLEFAYLLKRGDATFNLKW